MVVLHMSFLTEAMAKQAKAILIKTHKLFGRQEKMPEIFEALAQWVSTSYQVNVVNILFNTTECDRPRLTLIMKDWQQKGIFTDDYNNFIQNIRNDIINKLIELHSSVPNNLIKTDIKKAFIVTDDFESGAKKIFTRSIQEKDLKRIKEMDSSIWHVMMRSPSSLDVFFYAEDDINNPKHENLKERIADKWSSIQIKSNPFKYFSKKYFKPSINYFSKEYLDESYNGSWRWFYNDH